MKNLGPFFAIVAIIVAVFGALTYGKIEASETRTDVGKPRIEPEGVYVYTDRETGCQYIKIIGDGRGVLPRFSPDGTPGMGCRDKK